MTAPNGRAAVDNAREFNRYDVGMCLKFVRGEAWQIGALYLSAIDAWDGAKWKHRDRKVPLGAPVFYRGGEHGHIVWLAELVVEQVVSREDNRQRTTQIVREIRAQTIHTSVLAPEAAQLHAHVVTRRAIAIRERFRQRETVVVHPIVGA